MKMHYIYFILNYDEIQASGISSSHLLFLAQAPPTCCYQAPPTCCSWRKPLPLAGLRAAAIPTLFTFVCLSVLILYFNAAKFSIQLF